MRYAVYVCCTLTALFISSMTLLGLPQNADEKGGVDFQVIPEKTVYSPAAIVHIKFIVENTGELPLYLFRSLSECSSQIGSFSLEIHDSTGSVINSEGCSVDLLWDKVDVVQMLTDQTSGIQLKQWDIYGKEGTIQLPKKKGIYRLDAVLHLRVLQRSSYQHSLTTR
jgi:hypothetical protein